MLAVEAGYLMLGDSTINYTNAGFTSKNTALQIAAVRTFSVAPTFDLIGKLSMSMNSNKLVGTGAASFMNSSTSSTFLMFGIGAQYNVNKQVSIRAQYEDFGNFKTNDEPYPPVTSWDMGVSMLSSRRCLQLLSFSQTWMYQKAGQARLFVVLKTARQHGKAPGLLAHG